MRLSDYRDYSEVEIINSIGRRKMGERLFKIVSILVLMCMAVPATAEWMDLSSGPGQIQVSGLSATGSSSGIAVSGACAFYGILVIPDGTNDVTVKVWGNTAATGAVLIDSYTVKGTTGAHSIGFMPAINKVAGTAITGVYVSISVANGGTCTWKVQYDK